MAEFSIKLKSETHDEFEVEDELDNIPLQQRFKCPKIDSPCSDDVQGEAKRPKLSPPLQLIDEFIVKEEIGDLFQWKLKNMKIETEKKIFEFNWTGLVGQSLVSIKERKQRGFVTKESGLWLADRMLSLVITKGTEDGQSNCRRDHHAIVVLSVEANQQGRFVKVHITPTSSMGRNVCICVPEEEGGAGWRKVAEGLKIFIDGSLQGISVEKPACNMDDVNNQNSGKRKSQSHLIDKENSKFSNDSHGIAKDDASSVFTTSSFDSSSSKITMLSCMNPQYPQSGCDFQECLSSKPSNSLNFQENGYKCLLQATPTECKSPVGQEVAPSNVNNIHASSLPTFLANVKVETLESGSESQHDNIMGEKTSIVAVKGEIGTWEESYEDVLDHMPLRQRKELLFARSSFKLDTSKNLKCLRKSLPSAFECNPNVSKTGKLESTIRGRKRKKTATDSVETALEEDAPGLFKVLVDKGIMVDEIKLYGVGMESEDPVDISSEEGSFADLETVVSKLFSQRSSLFKFPQLHSMNVTKPSYCLACLLSLVEQTRYLQFRKWPVEWGWCRDLQSFIFVFERHNRIVLERPEYGYATYFFELVDCLPIDWQIKRLVTAMKLTSCSRTTLIENKSLSVGEDLSEGEARVLEEFGWAPNTGLGSMLNYCDRVVHDRRNDEDVSEWRSKIGKLLTNGLDGGTIMLSHVPKKFKGYKHTREPTHEVEALK